MKWFETGEHRRGKLCTQGLKTTAIADQSAEIIDDEVFWVFWAVARALGAVSEMHM